MKIPDGFIRGHNINSRVDINIVEWFLTIQWSKKLRTESVCKSNWNLFDEEERKVLKLMMFWFVVNAINVLKRVLRAESILSSLKLP